MLSLSKGGMDLILNDKSKFSNYVINGLWFNGKHMHFETIERGFNIYMEKIWIQTIGKGVLI